MSESKPWSSSLLAKLGVVRAEVSPSQGIETPSNRKLIVALALAATAALGAVAPENASANDFDDTELAQMLEDQYSAMEGLQDIRADNPYLYRYRVPVDNPTTFINTVNNAFIKLKTVHEVDLSGVYDGETSNYNKLHKAKDVAKDMYEDAKGKSTPERIFKGIGLIANPTGVLTETIGGLAVASGATYLTGDQHSGRSIGMAAGSALSVTAGYALLPQVTVVSASLNTVHAGFQIAEKIEDSYQKEAHRDAQRAVENARDRMSQIYINERLRIQAEDTSRYSPEQAAQAASTSELASNADISELLADEPAKTKSDALSGPSL